jgi:hypothetical protein
MDRSTVHPFCERWPWALALLGVLGTGSFFLFFSPSADVYPACVFHAATGFDCPVCGTSRGIHALVHGEWLQALGFNPFTVLLLLWLGGYSVYRLLRPMKTVQASSIPKQKKRMRNLFLVFFVGWMVFSVARNLV